MIDIHNEKELDKYVSKATTEVIEILSERILNIVKDYIMKDVYNNDVPRIYDTTYQFIDSWTKQIEKKGLSKEIAAEIFSDANIMKYEKTVVYKDGRYYNVWHHGSPEYGDLREEMSQIIEEGTKYFYPKVRKDRTLNPAAKKRRFFQDSVKELDKKGQIWKWFQEEMKKRGFYVEKLI